MFAYTKIMQGIQAVSAAVTDAYFNLVTLLLPGNGTNGAQNNTFLDSSSNNFTITRNGNTTQGTFSPFSQTGWGNYFDGDGDYLSNTSPTSVIAPGTSNFTAEFWVYPTTDQQTNGYGSVLHIGNSSSGAWAVSLLYSSAGAMKLRFSTSTTDYDSTSTISTNQWYHIAVVRSGTGTNQTTVYVNGASSYSFTLSDNLSNSSGIYVGTTAFNPTVREFTGYVSNLRLTVGTALYTGAFTPSTTPLTTTSQGATATQVELLTCQDNRFIDNSSNAFAITVNGTPSVQAFSPFAPTAAYSASTVGGSGYFDGSGDYLTTGTASALNFGTGNFTIEAWYYLTSTTNLDATLIANGDTSYTASAKIFKLYWFGQNFPALDLGSGNGSVTANNTAARLNQWNHVALVRSGNTFTMYLNGVAGTPVTFTGSVNFNSNNNTFVGFSNYNTPTNGYYTGYVSGLRATNTAVYSANFTPPTAPPTAISGTAFLLNFTNAGITDATAKNDLETVGNAQISTTQSKFGGSSMYFDGNGDGLYAPYSQNYIFRTGNWTIEFWMYFSSKTGFQSIISFGYTNGSAQNWLLQTGNGDGKLNLYSGVSTIATDAGSTVNTGQWYHIAVVKNGSTTTIYRDGVSVGSGTDTVDYNPTNTSALYIGGGSNTGFNNYYFNGYLDDIRITKGYARYTANFTPPTAAFALQ